MLGNNSNNENETPRVVINNNENGKDCQVKGMILRGLLDKPPMKGRELFDSIPYENYNSFRVLINRYSSSRYKYIERIGDKVPYSYKLTDTGRIHALNPFHYREKYRNRQAQDRKMFLFEILNNPDKLNHYFGNLNDGQVKTVFDTVKEYVNTDLQDFGDGSDTHQSEEDGEIDYEEKYLELQDKLKQLEIANFNLQLKLSQRPPQTPQVQQTSDKKPPSASVKKRYNLLCTWEGKLLTSSFFENELIPFDVLLKIASKNKMTSWKEKLNLDSAERIGIFARNISSTLIKEGLYRKATADEIKEAGFYLKVNRGIKILSKKYVSINKTVLKQSSIPSTATPSKNARIKIVTDKSKK
ncbi:hypothetical protein [Methanococcoides sp. LMO-2]|uniref:Uncharacterized protein n=1 Tax=Methanococcoides cohabitans TaxID=3136559 RepID=A0ABU9KXV3_9EURY